MMARVIDYGVPLRERILEAVEYDTVGGCWLWAGSNEKSLRGKIQMPGGRQVLAYRASYEEFVGPIPAGMYVCHRCDQPACVRPDHLFVGTSADNTRDMDRKGRRVIAAVPRGEQHPFTPLTESDVHVLRALSAEFSSRRLTLEFGITHNAIDCIVNRVTWKHVLQRPLTEPELDRAASVRARLQPLPKRQKLTADQVAFIRGVYIPRHPEYGAKALATRFGVTHGTVSMAARGVTHGAQHGVVFHSPTEDAPADKVGAVAA